MINCAGYTNVDAAEKDRETAFSVNAIAVGDLARTCQRLGMSLLHFSTDYVFNGNNSGFFAETDSTDAINAYGQSKLAGEVEIKQSGVRHLLIRTQWLYGRHGRSFVRTMCERAQSALPTRVVDDETGCCTYTVDVATAAWDLLERAQGTVHVANRGKASRFDVARRIFDHYGVTSLVTPCSSREFGSTTRRPMNSALSVQLAERLLGREMPSWQNALSRYLATRS